MDTYETLCNGIEKLEDQVYAASYGCPPDRADELCNVAYALQDYVFGRFNLVYFNPGEPWAEGTVETKDGPRDVRIPLTSIDADVYTCEEEDEALEAYDRGEELSLPWDLYVARIVVQHAKDVLEGGWQFGLEGVEPTDDPEELEEVLQQIADLEEV